MGRGHVSFWSDNWLDNILHGLLPCDIKLTVQEALPMADQFLQYIHTHLEDKARDTFLSIYISDRPIEVFSYRGWRILLQILYGSPPSPWM